MSKRVLGVFVLALALATVGFLAAPAQAGPVAVGTTGVYDEQSYQTNVVDTVATTDSVALHQVSLSTFTADVLAAFNSNLGGVIHFDDVDTSSNVLASDGLNASYGTSGGKTLFIGLSGNGGSAQIFSLVPPRTVRPFLQIRTAAAGICWAGSLITSLRLVRRTEWWNWASRSYPETSRPAFPWTLRPR